MASHNPYGEKLVSYMLKKELIFTQFQSCYYLLYQCLAPNTREALSQLVQHYSVPKDFERTILSGENPRVCNQGLFNYLLIMLRRDKDYIKFWNVIKSLVNYPELRKAVERIEEEMLSNSTLSLLPKHVHITTDKGTEEVFPIHDRALSATDNDDDYRVSYTGTMVDVRSCARPPRLFCPKSSTYIGFEVLRSHYSALVKSMPDDYMNTVSQLESHLSGDHIGSILECRDMSTANQRILDCLIEQICTKEHLLDFCDWFSTLTKAPLLASVVRDIKEECMKLIMDSNRVVFTTTINDTANNTVTTVTTTTVTTSIVATSSLNTATQTATGNAERNVSSTRPCLKDLQNDITPYYAAQWTVIGTQLGIHPGILQGIQASYPADAFRCCNMMLEKWLDTDCNASWDKVFKAIQCPGVTKAIQQHDASHVGIKFQPPPPCPANYIPRLDIINEISKVIVSDNSDENPIICIGITVTIRGIGGIGKSTLAKALCYHPLIKSYFIHGFLWISVTPPCLSPEVVLRDIYNRLTSNSIMCDVSLLKDKIRLLFSSNPCKLLIILDDVTDVQDISEYVEVFSSCKIVITTRKKDINITIPSKKCFDICPMKPFEAIQLLTWKIAPLATLSVIDDAKLQKLAKDLYYWPLLLNLVRGQLYIHCAAKMQSPTNAILHVEQKLKGKGLTAFDPQNVKKEKAVKASINSSLELLSNNEKNILFHIVRGVGIGSCVLKSFIFKISKVSSEEFERVIDNLWSHGLISFENVTLPPETIAVPCIELHEIIAQYIIEEMPYDYHIFLSAIDIQASEELFWSFFEDWGNNSTFGDNSIILTLLDVFFFPYCIRILLVSTRATQIKFSVHLDSLIKSSIDILKTDALMKYLKKKLPLSQIYGCIKENCRTIQSMFSDKNYDKAAAWLANYFDNHPYVILVENIRTLISELTNECKHNPKLIELINRTIGANNDEISLDVSDSKAFLISTIHLRKVLSETIEAGGTTKEIFEILDFFENNV